MFTPVVPFCYEQNRLQPIFKVLKVDRFFLENSDRYIESRDLFIQTSDAMNPRGLYMA